MRCLVSIALQEPSAEYRAFQERYNDLFKGIQHPLGLSAQLYSAGMLADSTLKDISSSPAYAKQLTDLLLAVERQIKGDPRNFNKLVGALEQDQSTKHLGHKLRDTCGE